MIINFSYIGKFMKVENVTLKNIQIYCSLFEFLNVTIIEMTVYPDR